MVPEEFKMVLKIVAACSGGRSLHLQQLLTLLLSPRQAYDETSVLPIIVNTKDNNILHCYNLGPIHVIVL